jgi:hypothetical protein
MKTNLIVALIAIGIFVTLGSCSKEEQADIQPVMETSNPLDPDGDGIIYFPEGEVYLIDDSISLYGQVGTKYLMLKPLSLEKYKNGEQLDSICNKDIAIRFDVKGRKVDNKSVLWGDQPWVTEEYPSMITFRIGNTLTLKFSKMLTAFGYEFNSPFTGEKRAIESTFRNSKINNIIEPVTVSYTGNLPTNRPPLGMPGGALLRAMEGQQPFDEVTIRFIGNNTNSPAPPGPFDISLASFRYKLAK